MSSQHEEFSCHRDGLSNEQQGGIIPDEPLVQNCLTAAALCLVSDPLWGRLDQWATLNPTGTSGISASTGRASNLLQLSYPVKSPFFFISINSITQFFLSSSSLLLHLYSPFSILCPPLDSTISLLTVRTRRLCLPSGCALTFSPQPLGEGKST
ncbi:hypothetical protein BDV25DRAFT_26919 [Aspergillus avenaceus]|uniref:Uncharacterized protein n=1 Tax=Aspergillus avenaceus TaxID=36643 RepID=A0A5N6TND8_ASPAV|nr:hypothetical protein BDV25DRAFT_26919 [Aspergillus avenaceus]